MKKLISAAAAMAMAASMVGSAVPFATGAADAEKGLYFDVFTNRDGKTKASTTISKEDITAGDVTIPVGVFMKENADTQDIKSIMAQWTVNAADGGDPTGITFAQCSFAKPYFDAAVDMSVGGTNISSEYLVGFSGEVVDEEWSEIGSIKAACLPKYDYLKLDKAYGSIAWVPNASSGYKYSGAKSDEFPVFVFEVTFPKGTKAGTYTVDFLDYLDEKNSNVPSTMIEIAGQKRLTPTSGLEAKSITFTVEGDQVTPPTTTTTPPPQTTTPPQTTKPPVTTGEGDNKYETKDDFTIEPEARTAKPGETIEKIPVIIDSNGRSVSTLVFRLPEDLPDGWEVELSSKKCGCTELGKLNFEQNAATYNAATIDPDNGHPLPIIDGNPMVYINIKVPEDAAPGDYEYFFARFHIVEEVRADGYSNAYNGKILPGKITIEGDAPQTTDKPAQTTTKAPDTTKAPAQTTTTAKPGTPLYGDANDNGEVNIADVVVLNKWLHNNEDYAMTDQGKLNANCCDVSAGKINAEDSDAIIKSLVSLVELPCAATDLK